MRNISKHSADSDSNVFSGIVNAFRSLKDDSKSLSSKKNVASEDNSEKIVDTEKSLYSDDPASLTGTESASDDFQSDPSIYEEFSDVFNIDDASYDDYRDEFARDYYAKKSEGPETVNPDEPDLSEYYSDYDIGEDNNNVDIAIKAEPQKDGSSDYIVTNTESEPGDLPSEEAASAEPEPAPAENEDVSDTASVASAAYTGARAERRARMLAEQQGAEKEVEIKKETKPAVAEKTEEKAQKVSSASQQVKKNKKKGGVEVVEDDRPLWEKNPEKYRKKKPFFIRLLGGLWSFIFFWILTGAVFGVLGVGLGVTLVYSFTDPELDIKLASLDIDYTSQILATDSSGEIVVYEELYSTANRVWVSINDMPKELLDATVAIEDKRFYEHKGVDLVTTFRATISYIIDRLMGRSEIGAGGSTLTQQLIKVITQDNAVQGAAGLQRKAKEILRAFYIERKYSKDQILEYYLNTVNFGYQYEGIYTAAKSYFGKEPKDLTLAECATIVAVTNWPSYYNPYESMENNRSRRFHILYEMLDQGKITREEYEAARNQEIVLIGRNSSSGSSSGVQSYFTDLVFEWLINELMVQKGYTRSYAINYIYTSGLRIYTTVDPDIQRFCEEYFSNEENFYTNREDYLASIDSEEPKQEVAFLLEDPKTGNVIAIIGGRGEKKEALGLNRVTMSQRQPGSSIKPLTVYGQAIERNLITAASAIDDAPIKINIDPKTKYENYSDFDISSSYDLSSLVYTSYSGWPLNYDRKYRGIVDVKIALSNSYNAPSARVLELVGIEDSFNFAKNMLGLSSLVDADRNEAPLSVGSLTYGVTVQEMVSAYTVFANSGIYSASRCVTRVETYNGKIILENDVDRSIVFTPQTAYLITDILERAVTVGTSAVANLYNSDEGIFIDTAGKSGTTTSFNDRWFIGYTPYYIAGIWWGYDKNTYGTTENTEHIRMWHEVMKYVHQSKGINEAEFAVPDGIVTCSYCSVSGKLAGPYCSSDPSGSSTVKTGKFKSGTQPTETCDVHHQLYVCTETGQIACDACPSAKLATFRDIMRSYPYTYIRTGDSEYICPPLSSNQILYYSQTLPVYSYMVPEGEYPTLSNVSKSSYKNCICSVHGYPGAHYYMYKFSSGDTDEEIYENVTVPDNILTPKELEKIQQHETDVELSRQIYNITGGAVIVDGTEMYELFPDLFPAPEG
ncbi:MAG: transglycosylase domain-containing protein [Clostridia bacterium]|nr:transglycosylase domain-containing protein [Clostridia bacterium]